MQFRKDVEQVPEGIKTDEPAALGDAEHRRRPVPAAVRSHEQAVLAAEARLPPIPLEVVI